PVAKPAVAGSTKTIATGTRQIPRASANSGKPSTFSRRKKLQINAAAAAQLAPFKNEGPALSTFGMAEKRLHIIATLISKTEPEGHALAIQKVPAASTARHARAPLMNADRESRWKFRRRLVSDFQPPWTARQFSIAASNSRKRSSKRSKTRREETADETFVVSGECALSLGRIA